MVARQPLPSPARPPAGILLGRFAVGWAVAFLALLPLRWLPPRGALAVLDGSVAVHVVNALLAGPAGWLGGLLGGFTNALLGRGDPARSLLMAGTAALPGLVAYLLFSRAGRLSRTLSDLPSFFSLAFVALVGGGFVGTVSSWLAFHQFHLLGTVIWSAAATAGVVLIVPPLLLAAEWTPAGLLTAATTGGQAPAGRPPAAAGRLVLGFALTLALALTVAVVGRRLPAAEGWLNLLLVLPVLKAAELYGQRGGVTAASLVGISYLALRTLVPRAGTALDAHLEAVGVLPLLLVFSLVGALRGAAWDDARRLTGSLERANRQLREDLEQTVRAFSSAIEAKDSYTERHVTRVAEYALLVGGRLGVGGEELRALHWAATLHDLGKIGVPESVLNKPGPLDAKERALIERHPETGARIVAHIEGMASAAPLVLHHQERWDGRRDGPHPGYPAGLAGEAIPLGARVIAVVDAFDAMTTARPYRPARPVAEAVDELRRESGRQFDPRVVASFLEIVAERPWD